MNFYKIHVQFIHNFIDVDGGFAAIKESEIEVSNYVCPSTL